MKWRLPQSMQGTVIERVLHQRGVTRDSFTWPQPDWMHDPSLFQDMDRAIHTLKEAIQNQVVVTFLGDFDNDGVCATAIGTALLRQLGATVHYFTNNRFLHGYGLNRAGLDALLERFPDTELIVTVDNGIVAFDGVAYAYQKGLRVLITDHHDPDEHLPICEAIINPKRKDCSYPFKGLCGAGVIYKVMRQLYLEMGQPVSHVDKWLDVVALATVGDIVPLLDENRFFTKRGLFQIRQNPRPLFQYWMELLELDNVTAEHTFAFLFVPMVNALGRLEGQPLLAIELFLSQDADFIKSTLRHLKSCNDLRKQMTEEQFAEAEAQVPTPLPPVIVCFSPDFHEGIIGLLAGRLKEKYHRPVFVFSQHHDTLKASARSIEGFHIKKAIQLLVDEGLALGGGGHEKAGGISVAPSQYDAFVARVNALAKEWLRDEDYIPKLQIDAIVEPYELSITTIERLQQLEPFGEGFPPLQLGIMNHCVDDYRTMGKQQQHLSLSIDGLRCIAWNQANAYQDAFCPAHLHLIGAPSINEFRGQRNPQFMIKDWKNADVYQLNKGDEWL